MALKRLRTKKSKRMTCNLKYKIAKKIRDHQKKERRNAKKNPKKGSKKQKLIQIPNICPFKEEILKDVEDAKKRQEEERKRRRELAALERSQNRFTSLTDLAEDADARGNVHSILNEDNETDKGEHEYKSEQCGKEQSLKQYFKEFKKVLDNADVVLEVVDARDPLGTRCVEVERAVRSARGNKRLVLVLNKADLVPKDNLNKWLKYFRRLGPVTAFKASTQDQTKKLGRRKMHQSIKSEKAMQGSVCVGAELLMSMLGNYCRNKGIKTSIRVGVVGIPNVGKSSIINSLTRGKTCSVGCTPGVTRSMQEVELDSKIKLIDCPGIVFSNAKNEMTPAVLKNAQRVGDVKDPFSIAESILKRASKEYFCKLYDITEYESFEEFFAKKAARMGKFLKKGVPDVVAAARSVLNDWNTGKIKYCTQPPEVEDRTDVHVSAAIVHEEAREFDVDNFEDMETEILNNFDVKAEEVMEIASSGPVECNQMEDDAENCEKQTIIENTQTRKGKKRKAQDEEAKPKVDPTMALEGNQTLNKNLKEQLKKKKKQNTRNEKKVSKIADVLDNFTLDAYKDEKYDFDEDYAIA